MVQSKKTESIEIPMHLARLLAAEPEDMKEADKYDDVQSVARALLRVLMKS